MSYFSIVYFVAVFHRKRPMLSETYSNFFFIHFRNNESTISPIVEHKRMTFNIRISMLNVFTTRIICFYIMYECKDLCTLGQVLGPSLGQVLAKTCTQDLAGVTRVTRLGQDLC